MRPCSLSFTGGGKSPRPSPQCRGGGSRWMTCSPERDKEACPMALRDHFRPPLSVRRHWHAFHNAWATYISSDLNRLLPEGYFAEANVQFGIEIDVATFEEEQGLPSADPPLGEGGNLMTPRLSVVWTPP